MAWLDFLNYGRSRVRVFEWQKVSSEHNKRLQRTRRDTEDAIKEWLEKTCCGDEVDK